MKYSFTSRPDTLAHDPHAGQVPDHPLSPVERALGLPPVIRWPLPRPISSPSSIQWRPAVVHTSVLEGFLGTAGLGTSLGYFAPTSNLGTSPAAELLLHRPWVQLSKSFDASATDERRSGSTLGDHTPFVGILLRESRPPDETLYPASPRSCKARQRCYFIT